MNSEIHKRIDDVLSVLFIPYGISGIISDYYCDAYVAISLLHEWVERNNFINDNIKRILLGFYISKNVMKKSLNTLSRIYCEIYNVEQKELTWETVPVEVYRKLKTQSMKGDVKRSKLRCKFSMGKLTTHSFRVPKNIRIFRRPPNITLFDITHLLFKMYHKFISPFVPRGIYSRNKKDFFHIKDSELTIIKQFIKHSHLH